jgi:hypothetical protein
MTRSTLMPSVLKYALARFPEADGGEGLFVGVDLGATTDHWQRYLWGGDDAAGTPSWPVARAFLDRIGMMVARALRSLRW